MKAYLSGGALRHTVVIDTVADDVLRDVGETIYNTSGVAVRPFWWSDDCMEVLRESW